ncbi:MAG: DUF1573 domain-containing protein [Bacteroidales bacterium]
MKCKSFPILTLIIFYSFSTTAQEISFEKTTHEFGQIQEEDGKVSYQFTFTNTGDKPLKIMSVKPSCGCTASDFTRGDIAPGDKGHITVQYAPKGRPGVFRHTIEILTNEPVTPKTTLSIKGKVIPAQKDKTKLYRYKIGNLRLKTNHMAFNEMKRHEIKTDSIGIYNNWDQPMELSPGSTPKQLKIEAKPKTLQPKQEGYLVFTYDASKKNDYGLILERFYIKTNDEKKARKQLNVSARLMEDFSNLSEEELERAPVARFDKTTHNFGEVEKGKTVSHNFILKNEGKDELKIRKVNAACGCTASKPGKNTLKSNEETEIKVSFNTRGRSGKQHQSVTVITNDPQNHTQRLRIQANVK